MKKHLSYLILMATCLMGSHALADQYIVECGERAKAAAISKLDEAIQSAQSTKAIQSYMERMRYKLQSTEIYPHEEGTYGWMAEGISWFYMSLANVGIKVTNSLKSIVVPHQPEYGLFPTNRLAPTGRGSVAYVPPAEVLFSDVGVNGKYYIYLLDKVSYRCGDQAYMTSLLLHEAAHLLYFGECSADRMAEIVQTLGGGQVVPGGYECAPGSWDSTLNDIYPKSDSDRAIPGGSRNSWWDSFGTRSTDASSNVACKNKCEYSYNKPACLKFYCNDTQSSYNPLSPTPPPFQYQPSGPDQDIARREIERLRQEQLRRQENARRAQNESSRVEMERRRQEDAARRKADLERQRMEWEARQAERVRRPEPPTSHTPVELSPEEKYLQCKYQCRKEGFSLYQICVEQTCDKIKPRGYRQ